MKTKFKILIISILFTGINLHCYSQNLIPNGSFEEFKPTDNSYAPKQFKDLSGGWEYVTTSPSDFRHYKPIIWNLNHEQCKIISDSRFKLIYYNYRQTVKNNLCKTIFQIPLLQTLKKDSFYRLSFYLWLGCRAGRGYANYIVDRRLVQFYTLPYKLKNASEIKNLKKEKAIGKLLKNKIYKYYEQKDWVFISYDFVAKGNEKYLLFGTNDTIYAKYDVTFAIDEIKLIQIDGKNAKIEDEDAQIVDMEIGTTMVVDDILFESNKSVLKATSYIALNKLINELEKNSTIKIQISGHTDNTGTQKHNLELSNQRAKSVVEYLISKGIAKNRLSHKGYGDTKPIADNLTEAGKKKNRRVELTIIEK